MIWGGADWTAPTQNLTLWWWWWWQLLPCIGWEAPSELPNDCYAVVLAGGYRYRQYLMGGLLTTAAGLTA